MARLRTQPMMCGGSRPAPNYLERKSQISECSSEVRLARHGVSAASHRRQRTTPSFSTSTFARRPNADSVPHLRHYSWPTRSIVIYSIRRQVDQFIRGNDSWPTLNIQADSLARTKNPIGCEHQKLYSEPDFPLQSFPVSHPEGAGIDSNLQARSTAHSNGKAI